MKKAAIAVGIGIVILGIAVVSVFSLSQPESSKQPILETQTDELGLESEASVNTTESPLPPKAIQIEGGDTLEFSDEQP